MPLYEYVCERCGHRFEVLQRMGAGSEAVECPECGGARVVKQFSTFSSAADASGGSGRATSATCCGAARGFT